MRVLLVSPAGEPDSDHALAALTFLHHELHRCRLSTPELLRAPDCDVVILDATKDLGAAAIAHERLTTVGIEVPLLITLSEGGMAAASADWRAGDVVLATAGPAEIEARLRLLTSGDAPEDEIAQPLTVGALTIDEASYTVRIGGRPLDLTYKEFELLKFLAEHPGRVFTRAQLLQDVWGYDYYGGTRTVDVHVRRLRAKLGADFEKSIGTVRNVGYRFAPEAAHAETDDEAGENE